MARQSGGRRRGFRYWGWLWRGLAWPLGLIAAAWSLGVRRTARVRCDDGRGGPIGPAIYVNWHRHVPYLAIEHGAQRRWQLMSPAPYMEPIVVWHRLMGLRSVRVPPGRHMREGFAALGALLREGVSVVLAVDGPAGPARRVKAGCVELAQLAAVPIIPVSYASRPSLQCSWRWDRALFVLPFDEIQVCYGAPIRVETADDPSAILGRIGTALDELECQAQALLAS